MGFKPIDVTPISATGPSVLIPTGKYLESKMFQVPRTQTVSSTEVVLPSDASIIRVTFFSGTASNAATTATVTVNVTNNTGTISTGVVDVKGAATTTAIVQMSALPNLEVVPSATRTGDIRINAVYAETGTASSTGGPWNFLVEYVR